MNNEPNLKKRNVLIRTPDHRLRVFVSSTLNELAEERKAVRQAINKLRLAPIMFESGARPHPAQELYQAYLSQSHIFIGIYWQSYGWIGPGMEISGLEDEYNRSANMPRLIYIKSPAPEQDALLAKMLERIKQENGTSYKYFSVAEDLKEVVENDLILLLTEYFETARAAEQPPDTFSLTGITNIPIPRNPLIGRDLELDLACRLLLREDVALVTLTGPAGTGKSRLGIQIALDLRDQFRDGVYMVLLESIHDPSLVVPTISKTLNITEAAGELTLLELLKARLCEKQMLLFLDNFEQVLQAAPQVAELLEACPKVKILVTSRASLRLRAEKELPIPPLAVPPRKQLPELQPLTQYSAVQLFIQRCQAVKADFQVTNENAPAIAEICNQLDGLPLAIELAAARINLLPPQALLSRLERRFEVLRGGMKDLPERHQTMYGAIDWSFNLLEDRERQLFQRLSVFRGGWTVEAALAVCHHDDRDHVDILDGLQILVDNNLIRSPEETSAEPRLRMLESIREYAYERLIQSSDSDSTHHSHAQFFASLAEKADKEKFGSARQRMWRDRLDSELDNLRAAMSWALNNDHVACELRIATGLWRYWWMHGYWHEGIQWLERGLSAPEPSTGKVRARALVRLGWMQNKVGDTPGAIASLTESVTLWRQIEDLPGLAKALSALGGVLLVFDQAKATSMLEEALKIRRGLKDQRGIDATLMNLGLAMQREGNFVRAIELYTESMSIAREVKDYYSMGITLVNLGDAYTSHGDYEKASECFDEAEKVYQNLGDRTGLADIKRGQGRIEFNKGEYGHAGELFSEACIIASELEVTGLTVIILEWIAFVAQKMNEPIKAIRLLSAGESLRAQNRLPRTPIICVDCDTYINTLRSTIDEAIFNTAWAEGNTMTLDQAVTYAIESGT